MTLNRREGCSDRPVSLPCGKCIGCLQARARSWAIRCAHEASLHTHNCFVTLTYDSKHVPEDTSLNVKHWQDFAKRVRKNYGRFRYLHCGEYGEQNYRPHYHALLFGIDFHEDLEPAVSTGAAPLYRSNILDSLWSHGACAIGELNRATAAYVAKYTLKRGDPVETEQFRRLNPFTGEEHYVRRPYATMSRRPGIGAGWYAKWKSDVFPSDEVVIEGRKYPVPDYYFRRLESEDPALFDQVKGERRAAAMESQEAVFASDGRFLGLRAIGDLTPDRLQTREEIAVAKSAFFSRRPL